MDNVKNVPRQTKVPKQLSHETLHLDQVSQGIGFGCANRAGVAHFREKLCDDIVIVFYLAGQ